ncbi:MAG: hypothetical protein U0Q16_22195 [Bryobacteraceae bacterium]
MSPRSWNPSLRVCFSRKLFCLVAALVTAACEKATPPVAAKPPEPPAEITVPRSREADDLARFFAGLPGRSGSSFTEFEQSAAFKAHAQEFDAYWKGFERARLPEMTDFRTAELAKAPFETAKVFYPFGGPDALTVVTFYPKSRSYILVGQEPPGTLPERKLFKAEKLGMLLPQLRITMKSLLGLSFFVTREMDRQFRGQVTDGLLPPILLQLARTGHRILGVEYIAIDDDGVVVKRPPMEKTLNRGIVIEFEPESGGEAKRLYYYSLNLANEKFGDNKPFLAYMEKSKPVLTYFKATSYMPHDANFTIICEKVLANSIAVVQDDSGIPFKQYDPQMWALNLYGSYDRPFRPFHFRIQEDLRKAFKAGQNVKPLKMRIGYGFGKIPSNLLVAVKKPTQS